MSFATRVLDFYTSLASPKGLPTDVITMNPYAEASTLELSRRFYSKYYPDNNSRTVLIGINPGRLGCGVTGVPFTDPIRLEEVCQINNDLSKKQELSSVFIYDMIAAYGGAGSFYSQFYLSAVSPLGFMKDGKNLNYYDINDYKPLFEKYALDCLNAQFELPLNRSVAYCIGQGQNLKFLKYLNEKYRLFERIEVLPHPRWVMQYKLKSKEHYIDEYLQKLSKN